MKMPENRPCRLLIASSVILALLLCLRLPCAAQQAGPPPLPAESAAARDVAALFPAEETPAAMNLADRLALAGSSDTELTKWKFRALPYLWLATTRTELRVGDRTTSSVLQPDDVLKHLNSAVCVRLEGSRGSWGGFIDIMDLRANDSLSSTRLDANVTMSSSINKYALFYRFGGSPVFDVYAGVDTYSFTTDIALKSNLPGQNLFPGRTVSGTAAWSNVMAGARLKAPLAQKLDFTLAGDVSLSGSRSLHYQAMFDWSFSPSVFAQAGYRGLYFEHLQEGQFHEGVSLKSEMYGPQIGVGVKF